MIVLSLASSDRMVATKDLAIFDAAPELTLGRTDEVLVKRIGMGRDLDPFAAASDHRKHRRPGRH